MTQSERWITIDGYADYMVSTLGRVKSLKHNKELILKWRFRKVTTIKHLPYVRVVLYKDGKAKHILVHRLVANAFIPNPKKLPQVNHLDRDVFNNGKANLEWSTPSGNVKHSIITFGRVERLGEDNPKSKLTECQVREIRMLYSKIHSQRKLAKTYNVCQTSIRQILNNQTWKHLN